MIVAVLAVQPGAHAQFTANFQTNIISGVTSNWSGNYVVGSNYVSDTLLINNGGRLSNDLGFIGYEPGANNNAAQISGGGSIWSNARLDVGYKGTGNRLVVTNGGTVLSGYGLLGTYSNSSGNSASVTGTGSVWSNSLDLYVGYREGGNQIIVSGGGAVFNTTGVLGFFSSSSNNVMRVTDPDSVWSNRSDLCVGYDGAGNVLVVTNGGTVLTRGDGFVGGNPFNSNNVVMVSGNGANWQISGSLYVGWPGTSNRLFIATGGAVAANNAVIGLDDISSADGNVLQVSGGSLLVTNSSGNGELAVGRSSGVGSLILDSGTVIANSLAAANGTKSVIQFNGGTFNSGGAAVTNGSVFSVGNGGSAATYHLSGGVHSFANGLAVRNNASLTGCGTISGTVLVDDGGSVVADCGGALTFTGSVANYGTMKALNGSTLESYGPVVNYGFIDAIHGATNFHSGLVNFGTVLTAGSIPQIISVQIVGVDVWITFTTQGGVRCVFQDSTDLGGNSWTDVIEFISPGGTLTFIDPGAATQPKRFYRIGIVLPQ
jgi:T5SS/PEP-CTERM-associated repeat protein